MNSKKLIYVLLFCILVNEINSGECTEELEEACKGVPGKEASCWVSVEYEKGKDCACITGIKGKLGKNQMDQFKSIFTSETWDVKPNETDTKVNVACNPGSFYGLEFIMIIAYFVLIF